MAPSREQRRLSLCVLLVLQVLQARRRRLREERIRRARARLERFRRFQNRLRSERAIFLATLATLASEVSPQPAERRMWMINRSSDWWETNQDWTELEWLENLRMTRSTFEFLCEELGETLQKETTKMRSPIPVSKRVALTLWKLATNADYRTIERVFGVAKSTICKILREVCEAIVAQFAERYVTLADADGLRAIADGFERRWGMPQCVGAVDCIHIPILAPADNPSGYCPPSGGAGHSIMAQIAVDDDYCITDLHVGNTGSMTDVEFFAATPLYRRGNAGTLFPIAVTPAEDDHAEPAVKENGIHGPAGSRAIGGVDVPYFLAADENYPLLSWVMTPFPEEPDQFSREKESFNERLEDVHHVAEEAWTRLKGRWRCLQTRNDGMVEFVISLVRACCVLHNICERNKHPFLQEWATANDFKMEVVNPLSNGATINGAVIIDGEETTPHDWRSGSVEAQKIRLAIAGNATKCDGEVGVHSPLLGADVYEDTDESL